MVVNATCHPVHEMCIPRVSADFPGMLAGALEESHPGCVALFLNGAAGNINPTTVSAGPDASSRHGMALAAAIQHLLARRHDVRVGLRTYRAASPRRRVAQPIEQGLCRRVAR